MAGGYRGADPRRQYRVRTAFILLLALTIAQAAESSSPRIVSLAPHLTELAFAAGAGEHVVGTVEYSDYPDAARNLPEVGNAWRVDMEQLVFLQPDVVLAWDEGTPVDLVARLEAMALRVVTVPTFSLQEVANALRSIGRIAGTEQQADAAAERFEAELKALSRRPAGQREMSVFVQLDDQPLYTVNGRHIIDEIVTRCGGRNVFAGLQQLAPAVSLEAVLARDPEVILNTDGTAAETLSQWSRWTELEAVQAGTIYALSPDTIARPTPRILKGMAETCAALEDARERLD